MSQRFQLAGLCCAAVMIPLLAWWLIPQLPAIHPPAQPYSGGTSYPASPLLFQRTALRPEPVGLPLITNVQIVDFNGDGVAEVLACDARRNAVLQFQPAADGRWTESILIPDVAAPAHVTPVDMDGDGDLDLLVAALGNIMPDDNVMVCVELFENEGGKFRRHILMEDVRRVADIQAADFDGDGDLDLAVAVFGYARGEVLWLENRGDFKFRDHQLLNASGTIHVPLSDYDGDGDIDIMAIVTQDEEELWAFENLGGGKFQPRRIWMDINYDLGSAGLVKADLDGDGDDDLILPAGDNLEDLDAYPQPYHGCYWFENRGNWDFSIRRISDLGGCYAAGAGDLDGDSDIDVVLVSMTNNWYAPGRASVVWLENDGKQNFTTWQIDSEPIHLVTVAVGDLNGDDRLDLVAGSLNFRKPHERLGAVTAWLNTGRKTP